MQLPLKVIMDDWARLPDEVPAELAPGECVRRAWQLDAMIAASIVQPGPLVLVTGI